MCSKYLIVNHFTESERLTHVSSQLESTTSRIVQISDSALQQSLHSFTTVTTATDKRIFSIPVLSTIGTTTAQVQLTSQLQNKNQTSVTEEKTSTIIISPTESSDLRTSTKPSVAPAPSESSGSYHGISSSSSPKNNFAGGKLSYPQFFWC